MPSHRKLLALLLLPASLALSGCDPFGLDEQAKAAAAKDAEGRAIGSACRHSGRSLEDCYMLNPKALKAAVFAGWRDMDTYMRENKIEVVPPPDYRAKPPEGKAGETTPPEGKAADGKSNEAKPPELPAAGDKAKPAAKGTRS